MESRQRCAIGSAAFGRLAGIYGGSAISTGDDYVPHPLIRGGLNEGFFSCGAHVGDIVACASAHSIRLSGWIIGEIHSSPAHRRTSALKSDIPVALGTSSQAFSPRRPRHIHRITVKHDPST
jgi:hypothetical protein